MTIFIAISVFIQLCYGQEIIIRAENSDLFKYEQYLQQNPSKKSYLQHLENTFSQSHKIHEKLKKAQFHFLEGSLKKSQSIFKEIVEQRWQENWKEEERKIFIYSILRLAQMEKIKKEKTNHLIQALHFDDNIPIKEKLFPPPLVAEYKKLKNQLKNKIYPLPENAKMFDKMFINGRITSTTSSFFKANSGKKRFSFISNVYKPIHIVSTAENLSKKILQTKPLITGKCQSPLFEEDFSKIPAYAFFDSNCLLPAHGKLQAVFPSSILQKNQESSFSSPLKEKKWKRSTWLWIGASIVGALATYKYLESQNQASNPRVEIQPNDEYFSNAQAQQ